MKHTTSRMLFAYWDAVRGSRLLPERGEIQPGGMRHVLADTFMLEASREAGTRFRLAGTRLTSLFGRDLTGTTFRDLWTAQDRDELDGLVVTAVTEAVGLLVGLNGVNENASRLPLELLLLPLRNRPVTEGRLLGALSPHSVPSWAGLVPLRSLETTSFRVIRPGALVERFGPSELRPEAGGRRELFVVHEGGRI